MKRLLIIIAIALAGYGAFCQDETVNILDKNFKKYLLANKAINTTKDDKITVAEARAFTGKIDVRKENITDLTGIEAFVNIIGLDCFNNQLTTLDVSQNTALTTLTCSDNKSLTTLDVSQNTALTTLTCSRTSLITLNVSNHKRLTTLTCSFNNNLKTINVSGATALTTLICRGNVLLKTLDVSDNTALTTLSCSHNNNLKRLDVSNNKQLTRLWCYNNSNLKALNLKNGNTNKLRTLKVSKNTALTCVQVDHVDAFKNKWAASFFDKEIISTDCFGNR